MRYILFFITGMVCLSAHAQVKPQLVSTTEKDNWIQSANISISKIGTAAITINPNETQQSIDGFGACFNELGWTSLQTLKPADRADIFKELFKPGSGANFNICRMPVGANDFARDWYSYDETDGDFDMRHFSIDNDKQTLIPFIKSAQQYNPALQLWASPWSPPQWMKVNHHYAAATYPAGTTLTNGLKPDQVGHEGTNMFIQQDEYFKAYAKYFSLFIDAYRKEGINIGMVMPQNEFNSAQVFPSCTWTAAGLAKFISYLGPQMQKQHVKLFFGTMERANAKLADTILTSPLSKDYVQGIGFQWAGKGAIGTIHQQYPNLTLYQSEQECGDGQNDWDYCKYTWGLMKYYFTNGARAYMYWNLSLSKDGLSRWGWRQNSLVTVDTVNHTYQYNHEYYLLKHISHFVKPGAKILKTRGNLLAFKNPDNSIVIIVQNETAASKSVTFKVGNRYVKATLPADSFNTILL
jgi:glucosylceramidase